MKKITDPYEADGMNRNGNSEANLTSDIREKQRLKLRSQFKSDITTITDYNKKQSEEDLISIEGQIIASFALGVLCGPYTYSIIFLILFFILYELIYFAIYRIWPIKLRLSVIIAYIIGILIGCYCAEAEYPTFLW